MKNSRYIWLIGLGIIIPILPRQRLLPMVSATTADHDILNYEPKIRLERQRAPTGGRCG